MIISFIAGFIAGVVACGVLVYFVAGHIEPAEGKY
jgi:hypothetical protein